MIDPGVGMRLLVVGEKKPYGYEVKRPDYHWTNGYDVGDYVSETDFPCRTDSHRPIVMHEKFSTTHNAPQGGRVG